MENLNLAYPKKIDVALPANKVCGLYNLPEDLKDLLDSKWKRKIIRWSLVTTLFADTVICSTNVWLLIHAILLQIIFAGNYLHIRARSPIYEMFNLYYYWTKYKPRSKIFYLQTKRW